MNRNTGAAVAATIAVVVVVVLGFKVLGSPGTQRLVQADLKTVQALSQLAQQINLKWNNSGKALPTSLEKFPDQAKQNPVTHELFVYHPKANSEYELCATFVADNRDTQALNTNDQWAHPKGQSCFQLDASQPVPQVPYYY
jgi:hypothetical protein